jgi:hypothetical protein
MSICMSQASRRADLKQIIQITIPFAYEDQRLTLDQAVNHTLTSNSSDDQKQIFEAAFQKDQDEVMKRLNSLYSSILRNREYKNKYTKELNALCDALTNSNPNAESIWKSLSPLIKIPDVSNTIKALVNMIPTDRVRTSIIESMVDDPQGFKKELGEVLKLCGMKEEGISKANSILEKLKTNSNGSDLFLTELPKYKDIVKPLMNLINEEKIVIQ